MELEGFTVHDRTSDRVRIRVSAGCVYICREYQIPHTGKWHSDACISFGKEHAAEFSDALWKALGES